MRQAVVLRVMGPLFTGDLNPDTGALELSTVVPDLNGDERLPLGSVQGAQVGDTMRVLNLTNNERGCGLLSPQGQLRAAVAADLGDRVQIELYRGAALAPGDTECGLAAGAEPYAVLDTFGQDITFQGQEFTAGAPLTTLAEGLGLRRNNPELRRFLGIGQIILDGADPAVYARHLSAEPLYYPNLREFSGANAMIVTTMGDMAVPASSGVTLGRAAGLIDYLNPDPRYEGTPYQGMTPNQILLSTYTAEAANGVKRFTYASDPSQGVHLDIENFSRGTDYWADDIPRLDPPIHLWSDKNAQGKQLRGVSGAIFPYPVPEGQHGFPFPGQLPDEAIRACERQCPEAQDCQCKDLETFDVGYFMFNMMAYYFRNGGKEISTDLCLSNNTCRHLPPPPASRDRAQLDQR